LRIATAESCTGGLLGGRLTSVPGSSEWYLGGVVAYADAVKKELLGVDPAVLEEFGAVSAEVARAMAAGVRARFGADIAVSVTGIAGPGGGTADKPVGLTYLGVDDGSAAEVVRRVFASDRQTNRRFAVATALDLVRRALLHRGAVS
jgi:nicotinamide-nucleotide amidase